MVIIKNIGKIFTKQRKSLVTFSFCLVLFALLQTTPASAQGWQSSPEPTPTPKAAAKPSPSPAKKREPVYRPAPPESSTTAPPAIPAYPPGTYKPYPVPSPGPTPQVKRKVKNASAGPAEKTIQVDPRVALSLCVSSGTIKVNGWDRDEVRAFVDGGSSLGFKVLQPNKQSKKAASVQMLGFDPKVNKELGLDECLDGTIELDMPFEAALSLKGNIGEISVDSIGKIRIENLSGDISLRNITSGLDATTFDGDIVTESTAGPVNLFASTGRIMVYDAKPAEIGDPFRAKSRSGAISLQNVEHSDMDVSSATGALKFTGTLESGGQYAFNTTSGKIEFFLSKDVSCKVIATYGGAFDLQIPFKDILHNKQPGIQKVIALVGGGDATLTVTTYNGSIIIKPIKK